MIHSFSRSARWKLPVPWLVMFGYLGFMVILPVSALLLKAASLPWHQFWAIATSKLALATYTINISLALCSTLVNGLFGTLLAWVLVRYSFPGKKLIDASIDIPFALPTAVAGVLLATIYSNNGWVGRLFAPAGLIGQLFPPDGLQIAFARPGVFIAMTFISLPFVVRTLQPVLEDMEKEVEEAAWCLGASEAQTFWQVIFPPLIPPILTGMVLSFSRAVGEFGSVVIIAANLPYEDMIAPVLIFERLEQYDVEGATVIGVAMLFLSVLLIFAINLLQHWGVNHDA